MIKFLVNGYGYLSPKNDVTALESVYLSLLIAAVGADTSADYSSYVKTHNLERHFTVEIE